MEELEEEVGSCESLLRDGKAFIMRLVTFTDFKKVLEDRFGQGANAIFYEVGRGCGQRSCSRLMQRFRSREELLNALKAYKQDEKWGVIDFDLDLESGVGTVTVYQSFEAKQYGHSLTPVCYFLRGYLAGFLSQTFGKPLRVVERSCIAQGRDRCVFAVEEEMV